ncbi:MAG: DUF2520 domain-containing protein [Anaerolineae bacterium]
MRGDDLHQSTDSDGHAPGPVTLALGVIGAGRVGNALARLLAARGWPIVAVTSRTPEHAHELADAVGADYVPEAASVLARADLTLLTVPDDAITACAEDWVDAAVPGHAVVHTSGVHGAEALAPLARRGMRVGSLHPAFPFAGGETPVLAGVFFAIESDDLQLRRDLLNLVAALGGVPLLIPAGGKATYHAALAIASNYAVTLYAEAERMLMGLGIPRETADGALNGLLEGTVANLIERGIPGALTGPLSRADVGTVRRHLLTLEATDPELAALYAALARRTLPLVRARGLDTGPLQRLLEEESAYAPDGS